MIYNAYARASVGERAQHVCVYACVYARKGKGHVKC